MKDHYINWHQHFTHPKAGRGKEFPWILKIAKTIKEGRILDWGCGKGGTADYIERETGKQVSRYDPGYKPYSIKPEGCFELVYSTDVFEHVEEEDLDSSINQINSMTTRLHAHIIDLMPARKILPDGRNAHVTLWSGERWMRKFSEFNKILYAKISPYPDRNIGRRYRLHVVCQKLEIEKVDRILSL